MEKKLFGTDGIRGIVGQEITSSLAYRAGISAVSVLKTNAAHTPNIIVATDTRSSKDSLSLALCAGITAAGANAVHIGVLPTPAVSFLTKNSDADAGIMISASHNPYFYNGIKIFDKSGVKLSDELEAKAEKIIIQKNFDALHYSGKLSFSDMTDKYVSHLLSANDLKLKSFKIGVDTANGAAYKSAKLLFSKLGIEAYFINDMPSGSNINEKCGSTDTSRLSHFVKENKLDLGIAFDGDADRLIAVDEMGEEIDGNMILAICADYLLATGKLRGGVVATIMSNLALKNHCNNAGFGYIEAQVGDRNVLLKMTESGYNLGGEQSGHIIFSDLSLAGDGQLSAIKLLEALSLFGIPLSEIRMRMKKYPQITINIQADENERADILSSDFIRNEYERSKQELADRGKIILRASGTEPLIRIMVEAKTEKEASDIARRLQKAIESKKSI